MTTETKKPVQTYKLGRVKTSIWKNAKADGETFYTASFERSYKDHDGKWHNSHAYGLKDVLNLIRLFARVARFMTFPEGGNEKEAL